jgi:hypothetical protein
MSGPYMRPFQASFDCLVLIQTSLTETQFRVERLEIIRAGVPVPLIGISRTVFAL